MADKNNSSQDPYGNPKPLLQILTDQLLKQKGSDSNNSEDIDNKNQKQNNNSAKQLSLFLSKNVFKTDLLKRASKYKILEFVKIIGSHKNTADEIKELKNGFFASYGTDNKLIVYDKQFNIMPLGEDLGDWIYHILEITSQEKIDRDIQIIICTNKCLYLNQISIEKNTSRIQRYEYGGVICLEIKKNNYVICGEEGVDHFSDLFSKIIQSKMNKLFNEYYRDGFVINQNLVVFASNKVMNSGEDHLKFYNPNSKKIVKEIDNNSFILTSNGLTLIESGDRNNSKIFLAACKKYLDDQKNGILTVVSFFGENDPMKVNFIDTGNFEVYCFCPISIIKKDDLNNGNILNENSREKIEKKITNYFLVGGYNQETRCGLIKLYKAIFNEKEDDTYIIYIQDIEIDKVVRNEIDLTLLVEESQADLVNIIPNEDSSKNREKPGKKDNLNSQQLLEIKKKKLKEKSTFNGFNGPISSIIQSSINGNIVVTCYDGNIYLLTPPNLDYYFSQDKENKETS